MASAACLAQGKPQFIQPQVSLTSGQVTSFVTGDFQQLGTGLPDILYLNAYSGSGSAYQVTVGELLNKQGFTNLIENQIIFANTLNAAAALGDFDGDHLTDYAFALIPALYGSYPPYVCVYYGTGANVTSGGSSYNGGNLPNAFPPTGGKSGCMSFPTVGTTFPKFSYIAAAPFTNNSGLSQLILEDTNKNYIYILANKGVVSSGGVLSGFSVKATYAIPAGSCAGPIYTGDFNNDGNTDFIVNGQTCTDASGNPVIDNSASVYFGNGDGTFQAPLRLTFDHNVHSMLLHDMDGGGYPDLVVEGDNGVIEIFNNLNTTAHPFAATPSNSPLNVSDGTTGHGGHLAAIGDVNGDGILDILTTTPIGLSVLLGQGGLQYNLKGIYNIGPGRSSFTLADFDGDGKVDLAVDSPEGVAIAQGNGDGSFQTSNAYSAGQPGLSAAIADFTGDGKLDVAVGTGTIQAQILTGDGEGAFTALAAPTNTVASPNPTLWSALLTGDFDGDGCPDLLYSLTGLPLPTPGPNAGSGLYLQYGNKISGKCNGTFATPVPISPQAVGAQSLTNFYGESAVADLNGDGITDIVNLDQDFYNTLLSQPTGPFKLTLNLSEDAVVDDSGDLDSFSQAAAGYFLSGRGSMQDLIFQDDANITPYVNNRDGSFTAMAPLSNVPQVSALYGGTIIVADIDGDGRGDIIIPYHNLNSNPANPSPSTLNQLYIWYGNGDGTFSAPQITPLSRNYYLAQVVDMNKDGLPDIVLSDGYMVDILYNQGARSFGTTVNGVFTPVEQHFLAGQGINSLSLADVNGDGSLDLIVANGGATISDAVAIGGKTLNSISLTPNPDVNTGGITVLLNKIITQPVTGVVTATPEPSKYQAGFTVTAVVTSSPGIPVPTGTVTFSIGGVQIGTSTLAPTGGSALTATATFTVPVGNTYQGTVTLEASYSGDTFNSPLPFFATHAINGGGTVTTLALCVGPSFGCPLIGSVMPPNPPNSFTMYYGQYFNGDTTVSATDGSALDPTSTITLFDTYNGVLLPPLCKLPATIVSSCDPSVGTTVGTSVGTNVFTSVYSGDATHSGSTSPSVTIVVLPDTNVATLVGTPNPSPQGQPVTFTATFTGNFAAPTGTAIFTYGAIPLGPATLTQSAGSLTSTAVITTSILPVGKDTITVTYAATMNFAAAFATFDEIINTTTPTTTKLTSSPNPSIFGQSVTFVATVSTATGAPIPTGNVIFADNGATFGTAALVNGVATLSTAILPPGTDPITATFGGDSATGPSSSVIYPQIVNPLPPAGSVNFTITVTPSPVTLGVGNTAVLTVTITPLNGFTQSVNLSCSNLPYESTCSFVKPTIQSGGGSTTLLLSTMAPHNCGGTQPYFTGSNGPSALPFAAPLLAGLAVLFIPGRRRWLRALVTFVAIAGAMQITGCGTCTDLGTRPNTYTIQIVGAASGTTEVESTPVTLSVTI